MPDDTTDWPGPDHVGRGDVVAVDRPPPEILEMMGLADATDAEIAVAMGAAHPAPPEPEP